MSFRTTCGLFAILLLFLGVAVVVLFTGHKPGEETLLLPGPKALKLLPKDFDSLTIERTKPNEEKLVFHRTDDKHWTLEKPVEARADAAAVERVIDDLISAHSETNAHPPKNLADVGLDHPSLIVTLARKGGSKYSLSFGSVTLGAANAEIFTSSSERPKRPTVARRGSFSSFLKSEGNSATTAGELVKPLADFRSKDLLLEGAGFNPAENVASIRLADGKHEIDLAKTADGTWKFDKPAGYGPAEAKGEGGSGPDAAGGVEGLVSALVAIKPVSTEDIIDSGDLGKFGLEKNKISGLTITVNRKNAAGEARPETLYIGNKDDATGKMFVRLDGESSVEKVPANLLDPVKKVLEHPNSLRDRQLFAFAPLNCDAIDIKLPSEAQPVELRKTGTPAQWKLFNADGKEQDANAPNVTELLNGLGGKVVKEFPEAGTSDANLGFDHPAAELTFYVGGIIPEEKKEEKKDQAKDKNAKKGEAKDKSKAEPKEKAKAEEPKKEPPTKPKLKKPAAKLIVGKKDKDLLYVRRIVKDKSGKETKNDFAISSALAARLTRGRLEYVDTTLASFVPTAATKLDFNRGSEEFTIEHPADKSAGWIIRRPADRADRSADPAKINDILSELAHLSVVKLWSEKPSDKELERIGLKPPKVKATVTVKDSDKTKDRLYFFGAETEDKTGYYARQGDRDVVFIVSKVAVPDLETGEIQDPVVLRLDAGKVTEIKLTGWKDVVGSPTMRDLEHKGASNWVPKGDDKIKLSAGQCEAFLNALTLIRADAFIAHKLAAPKPEYKLDLANGALQIAVSEEGEKEPVILTIGGPDAENKHFYATCSKLAGDVFLLPKGVFEAVKAKPGYFAAD